MVFSDQSHSNAALVGMANWVTTNPQMVSLMKECPPPLLAGFRIIGSKFREALHVSEVRNLACRKSYPCHICGVYEGWLDYEDDKTTTSAAHMDIIECLMAPWQ